MVLKTTNQQQTEKQLCSILDTMGGWLLIGNRAELRIRLPQENVKHFLESIDSLGVITDKYYSRVDLTNDYLRLVSSIQAKGYLLKQYLDILDSSGSEGIYPVSRAIADLQYNIELLKGQKRGMVERMYYAEIRIAFNFNDRRMPLVSGQSEFQWLNTVNLPSLLEDFK
jgi:hypothetical protein